jgi:hypothetical protein
MSKRAIFVIRAAVFLLGAALITLGIFRDELTEIMQKGAVICLECIGIG